MNVFKRDVAERFDPEELAEMVDQIQREREAEKQLEAMADEPEPKEYKLSDFGIVNRQTARAAGLRMVPRQRSMKVPKKHPKRRSRNSL